MKFKSHLEIPADVKPILAAELEGLEAACRTVISIDNAWFSKMGYSPDELDRVLATLQRLRKHAG